MAGATLRRGRSATPPASTDPLPGEQTGTASPGARDDSRGVGSPESPWSAAGPPDAAVVVFLHGTRLTRGQWAGQLRRLSGRYRCIALDLPGHGGRAGQTFTHESAVRAVIEALDAEAPGRRALLVGLSLGGYVAIEVAETHPGRVSGLVLAGASAEPVGPVTVPFRVFAWIMEHRITARLFALGSGAFFRARYPRAIAQPIVRGRFWSKGGADAIRTLVGRRYLERVQRLWTPIVIVNGALDPVFRPGGDPWAHAARRGRHVVIPWALHLSNLDRPSAFSRVVADALEAVRASSETTL